jgi:hypothetical protein
LLIIVPMRVELIPIVAGVLVGLFGLGLLFDAWTPDEIIIRHERRRTPRVARDRNGEACVGLGVLGLAAAFLGGDSWPYTVVAVVAGSLALIYGVWRSRWYLAERIVHRGALRRKKETG